MNSVLTKIRQGTLVLAVPALAACTIVAAAVKADATPGAIAALPINVTLAQFSPGTDSSITPEPKEPDQDGPYKILLGVALVVAVVSGAIYLRSES